MASDDKEKFYEILQVDASSSINIQRSYIRLALQYHPDRHDKDKESFARFEDFSTAYRHLLSDQDINKNLDGEEIFFDLLADVLLLKKKDLSVHAVFTSSCSTENYRAHVNDMCIDNDDDDNESGEQHNCDVILDILENRRRKGKPLNDLTEEKIREAFFESSDNKKQTIVIKNPNQVPVSKPKPKSKKQKAAEQRRREKEMEAIKDELKEKVKFEEERAEKKKQAEIDKQKRVEGERARQAAEDKRKDKERQEREKKEREEEERKEEEELKRKESEKKKKTEASKKKQSDLKTKEEEEKKKQQVQQQLLAQQQQAALKQQRNFPPRELPPRFAKNLPQQKQQQQQQQQTPQPKMQSVGAPKKSVGPRPANGSQGWGQDDDGGWSQGPAVTGSGWTEQDSASASEQGEIGTWQNPSDKEWRSRNDIIVDSKDREAWPSIGNTCSSSESPSENGEDNAYVQSGSVISSSSSNPAPTPEAVNQGSIAAVSGQSASSLWGANSTINGLESNTWGAKPVGSALSANMNSMGWGNLPPSTNNQGHNMQTGTNFPGDANLMNSTTSNPMAPLGWGSTVTPPTQGGSNPRPQNSVQMPGNGSGGGGRLPTTSMPPPPATANGAQLHNNGATQQQQATLSGSMPNPMPWQGTPAAASSSSMAPGGITVMQKGQEGGGRWSNPIMPPPMGTAPTNMATNNPRSLGNNDLGGTKEGSNTASAGNSQDPSLGWGGAASNASSKSPLGSSWGHPVGAPAPTSQWGEQQQQKTSPQWAEPPKSASQQWATQQPPPPSGQSQDQWGVDPMPVDDNPANAPKSQSASTWAQAAGKGLVTKSSPTAELQNEAAMPPIVDEFDRVINCNEGWGQRPVRQDTAWDTPESPQTKRKLNEKGTNSWNNNNNGTAIWEGSKDSAPPVVNWNNAHGNPASSQWDGGEDKMASNNWGVTPSQKPPQQIEVNSSAMVGGVQPNNWGVGGVTDPRSSASSWDRGQSRPPPQPPQPPQSMGNKTESSAWGANIPPPRNASWGEPPIEAAPSSWQEPSPSIQRRQLSSSSSSQMPIDPGAPGYWGDAPPKQQTSWSGSSNPSTPATPMTPRPMPDDQQWNKAPPKPGGWGDPSPPNVKVDDGTSLWAANAQQQAKAGGWGDTGDQWNAGPSKPKPSGPGWEQSDMNWSQKKDESSNWQEDGSNMWDDADMGNWNEGSQETNSIWSSAQGFKQQAKKIPIKGNTTYQHLQMVNKFPTGGHPQMRSKMLQQLCDMGFKRDEAQNALISSNMNLENALAYLMQGGANKRDTDIDIFSSDGAKRRMPGMGVDGPDGDIISDTQTDTSNPYVPSISMHNTPFNNAQSSQQQLVAASQQQQLMLKPPGGGGGVNSQQSSLNAAMLQTKILQKLQQQHHQTQPPPPTGPVGMNYSPQGLNRGGQMQAPPPPPPPQQQQQANAAAAKEQHVLQQLKMAVQAGLISSQLLQQRLPPQLLFLLQQLLQCQTLLQQQVNKQQGIQQNKMSLTQAQRQQVEQHTIIIAKIRQQIVTYQQQIAQAQQVLKTQAALAADQQQPGENNGGTGSQAGMPLDLTNLGISGGGGGAQQQQQPPQLSRLSQWKQPTPDKDLEVPPLSAEINKAPGSKPLHASNSTSNLDLVFLNPNNTTWSTVAPTSSQNWPAVSSAIGSNSHAGGNVQAGVDNAKDCGVGVDVGKESQPQVSSQASSSSSSSVFNMEIGDIQVPEFIPGQPWIGFSKNVEDDPHITPGSVSNSLSVNVIRGEHLSQLSNAPNKSSPNPITSDSVGFRTQSTWAVKDFPKTAISSTSNSLTNKTWSNSITSDGGQPPTTFSSEVWGVPFPKNSSLAAPTRPPPGLTNQSKSNWNPPGGGVNRQTSWSGRTETSAFTPVNPSWDGRSFNSPTHWLLLKNLTPQIDGSTLRTLCQQHGPLMQFHLSLNHGQALVKYCSKDETFKAQKSLNSCLLGNTTILAEFVTDGDAARIIDQSAATTSQWSHSQHSITRSQSTSGQWNAAPQQPPMGSGFPPSNNNSLMWGTSTIGGGNNGNANSSTGGLWGGIGSLDDHNGHPLLTNILGGDSM